MAEKVINQERIPDSSFAEEWLSEDVFVYQGEKYRILPGGDVVRVNGNDKGGQNE